MLGVLSALQSVQVMEKNEYTTHHVVAASILLNADIALRALWTKSKH